MNLHPEFVSRMIRLLGAEQYSEFESALNDKAPVSVRINKSKIPELKLAEKINWCNSAYYLSTRPVFASDPFWHGGAYYVQEASSMLLEKAFNAALNLITGPLKVLDLCAAPGGKSTHIASMLGSNDLLVCNEVIRSRVGILAENIRKQGYSNTIICSADVSDFARCGEVFDIIVLDAPCSGEGLFRKDPDAVNEWSTENVKTCELRQKRIIDSAIKCLKTGGILIYSTCTFNPGENENQIEQLLASGFERAYFELNGEKTSEFHCYPHIFRGEGFYISMLRKTGGSSEDPNRYVSKNLKPLKANSEWLRALPGDLACFAFQDQILTLNSELHNFLSGPLSGIYCYSAGTILGVLKDKHFQPSEYLPFSLLLQRGDYPEYEADIETALSYLNRNPLPYSGKDKGHVIITHRSLPLGFGKFAGNRINNRFPAEWKLRNIPDISSRFCIADLM